MPIFSSALSSELQICKYNIHLLNKNLLNLSETHQNFFTVLSVITIIISETRQMLGIDRTLAQDHAHV